MSQSHPSRAYTVLEGDTFIVASLFVYSLVTDERGRYGTRVRTCSAQFKLSQLFCILFCFCLFTFIIIRWQSLIHLFCAIRLLLNAKLFDQFRNSLPLNKNCCRCLLAIVLPSFTLHASAAGFVPSSTQCQLTPGAFQMGSSWICQSDFLPDFWHYTIVKLAKWLCSDWFNCADCYVLLCCAVKTGLVHLKVQI